MAEDRFSIITLAELYLRPRGKPRKKVDGKRFASPFVSRPFVSPTRERFALWLFAATASRCRYQVPWFHCAPRESLNRSPHRRVRRWGNATPICSLFGICWKVATIPSPLGPLVALSVPAALANGALSLGKRAPHLRGCRKPTYGYGRFRDRPKGR